MEKINNIQEGKINVRNLIENIVLFFVCFELFPLYLFAPIILIFVRFNYLKKLKQFKIFFDFLMISSFSILYFLLESTLPSSERFQFLFIISIIAFFLSGLSNSNISILKNKFSFVATVMFLYVFVTFVYNYILGTFQSGRDPINIWTFSERAATHYGSLLVIPLSYSLFAIFSSKIRKERRLAWFIVLASLLITLFIGSRTILYLFFLQFTFLFLITVLGGKKSGSKKVYSSLSIFTFIAVLFLMMFQLNLFNFQDYILESQLGIRIFDSTSTSFFDDPRFINSLNMIKNFTDNVLGGGYFTRTFGNPHNVWLNIYDISGLAPFVFFLIYTITICKSAFLILINKKILYGDKVFIFLIFLGIFIQFMFEPILDSVPIIFWLFVYFNSSIRSILIKV